MIFIFIFIYFIIYILCLIFPLLFNFLVFINLYIFLFFFFLCKSVLLILPMFPNFMSLIPNFVQIPNCFLILCLLALVSAFCVAYGKDCLSVSALYFTSDEERWNSKLVRFYFLFFCVYSNLWTIFMHQLIEYMQVLSGYVFCIILFLYYLYYDYNYVTFIWILLQLYYWRISFKNKLYIFSIKIYELFP